jgi:hypothetical protein
MASVSNGTVRIQDTLTGLRDHLRRLLTFSTCNAVHTPPSSPGVESSDSSVLSPPSCAGPDRPVRSLLSQHPVDDCAVLRLVLTLDRCAARDGLTLTQYAPLLDAISPAARRELVELLDAWELGLRDLLDASSSLATLNASFPQAPAGSASSSAHERAASSYLTLCAAILWVQCLAAAEIDGVCS